MADEGSEMKICLRFRVLWGLLGSDCGYEGAGIISSYEGAGIIISSAIKINLSQYRTKAPRLAEWYRPT
jgi:hypothetical protein